MSIFLNFNTLLLAFLTLDTLSLITTPFIIYALSPERKNIKLRDFARLIAPEIQEIVLTGLLIGGIVGFIVGIVRGWSIKVSIIRGVLMGGALYNSAMSEMLTNTANNMLQQMFVEEVSQDNLIEELFENKKGKYIIAYISLLFSLIGEYALFAKQEETSIFVAMILTALLFIFSLAHYHLLKYRVRHGLYGTCYSEARELVAFILKLQKKSGNSNGGTPKLIFTQEELKQRLQIDGGEEYAG